MKKSAVGPFSRWLCESKVIKLDDPRVGQIADEIVRRLRACAEFAEKRHPKGNQYEDLRKKDLRKAIEKIKGFEVDISGLKSTMKDQPPPNKSALKTARVSISMGDIPNGRRVTGFANLDRKTGDMSIMIRISSDRDPSYILDDDSGFAERIHDLVEHELGHLLLHSFKTADERFDGYNASRAELYRSKVHVANTLNGSFPTVLQHWSKTKRPKELDWMSDADPKKEAILAYLNDPHEFEMQVQTLANELARVVEVDGPRRLDSSTVQRLLDSNVRYKYMRDHISPERKKRLIGKVTDHLASVFPELTARRSKLTESSIVQVDRSSLDQVAGTITQMLEEECRRRARSKRPLYMVHNEGALAAAMIDKDDDRSTRMKLDNFAVKIMDVMRKHTNNPNLISARRIETPNISGFSGFKRPTKMVVALVAHEDDHETMFTLGDSVVGMCAFRTDERNITIIVINVPGGATPSGVLKDIKDFSEAIEDTVEHELVHVMFGGSKTHDGKIKKYDSIRDKLTASSYRTLTRKRAAKETAPSDVKLPRYMGGKSDNWAMYVNDPSEFEAQCLTVAKAAEREVQKMIALGLKVKLDSETVAELIKNEYRYAVVVDGLSKERRRILMLKVVSHLTKTFPELVLKKR